MYENESFHPRVKGVCRKTAHETLKGSEKVNVKVFARMDAVMVLNNTVKMHWRSRRLATMVTPCYARAESKVADMVGTVRMEK